MALYATPKVEAAFGKTWQDTVAVEDWTDITAYVRETVCGTGRQRQLDRPEAGKLSLILSNADRRFEPLYAGAYSPDVKVGVPVRVTATVGETAYPVWYGYATGWPQDWPGAGGRDATVRVSGVDGFQFLSLADVSPYPSMVAGLSPFGYWRQQEQTGTDCLDTGSDANPGTYVGTPTLAQAGPLSGTSYAVTYAAAKYADIGAPTGSFDACDCWTWASWLYRAGTSETVFRFDADNKIVLAVDASGKPTLTFGSSLTVSGLAETVTAATALTLNTWTHVTVVFADDLTTVYLDGTVDRQQMVQLAAAAAVTENFRISASSGGWTGRLSETSLWDYALDAGTVAQLAAATIGTHPAETADVRIARLLDAAGWPAGTRDLDVGQSTLTEITEPSGTALEQILRAAVDSELGYFYQAPDGVMTFYNRAALSGGSAVAALVDTDYRGLEVGYDDDSLYTQARVTLGQTDGGTIVKADAAAIAAYGPRALERTADLSAADALDMAGALLARYSSPRLRASTVELEPQSDPTAALYAAVLAAGIWEKISVSRTPPGGGDPIAASYWVEGIRHEIRPDQWKITLSCSPTADTEAWVLGVSKLDESTILGY